MTNIKNELISHNDLYVWTQINFAYHSNKIEGSKLAKDKIIQIFGINNMFIEPKDKELVPLDDALEAIKAGEMQGTVYNDKEDQALQIAKLAVEIFRGEDVNRNKLKEGRYYVSEYQPVYSSNVEDFIKRQTR